jgi:hypothetical protein
MFYVMVLNDDETYTGLFGCKIVAVKDEWEEQPELDSIVKDAANGIHTSEAEVVTEFKF